MKLYILGFDLLLLEELSCVLEFSKRFLLVGRNKNCDSRPDKNSAKVLRNMGMTLGYKWLKSSKGDNILLI